MAIVPRYITSCVRGVHADATILFKSFSMISSIISFCALSVHRNEFFFEMTISLGNLFRT
ncbi:MAG: hypothetical protein ACFFCI_21745 [Promethearchaeota archaeon]